MKSVTVNPQSLRYLIVVVFMTCLAGPVHAWHTGLPSGAVGPDLSEIRDMLRSGEWSQAVESIDQFLPFLRGSDLSTALLLGGKAKIAHADPSGVEYIERIDSKMPVVDHRRQYWLVRGYLLRGDAVKAQVAFKAYRGRQRSDVEGVRLRLELAELVAQKGASHEALQLLEPLKLRRLGWDEQTRLLRLRGVTNPDRAEGERLLRKLSISHPEIPLTNDTLSPSERFRRADRLAQRWHYEEALREYEALFAQKYRRTTCAWKIAVILQSKLRREPERVRKLLAPITASPAHKHHEEALFRTIRAYIKEDRYKEALELITAYDKVFPEGKFREATAYYRGWLPYDSGKCRKGLPALRAYVKLFSKRRRHVRGFIAWCHIRHARWKSAIRGFAPLLRERDSMHRGKGLYWQAFSYSKLGDAASARKLLGTLKEDYPFSYYGFLGLQLEAQMEGRPSRAGTVPWPHSRESKGTVGNEAWTWPNIRGGLRRTFDRVKKFIEVGELQLARETYMPIRDRIESAVPTQKRYQFMGFMGFAIEDFNRGYKATGIKRGSGKGMSPQRGDPRWHTAFPLAYRSLVENLAKGSSIHPLFIYSIMRAESAYLASAVSHAEAVGALQMIRPTAMKVAAEIGLTYSPQTFQDPRVGFRYSVHYMQKHLDLWKGNFILAAASYNAGPEPVARWLKTHQDKSLPFVVEEFAYNETRTYARRVAEFLLRYIALYPVPADERSALLDGLFPTDFRFPIPTDVGY